MVSLQSKPVLAGGPTPAIEFARRILQTTEAWHRRARERRELALLSAPDFADLGISPGLARSELRRWPWQRWDAAWGEVDAARRAPPSEPAGPRRCRSVGGGSGLLTLAAAGLTILMFGLTPMLFI
jgi:uncharacterized protein YjiS (DUF1127 family)